MWCGGGGNGQQSWRWCLGRGVTDSAWNVCNAGTSCSDSIITVDCYIDPIHFCFPWLPSHPTQAVPELELSNHWCGSSQCGSFRADRILGETGHWYSHSGAQTQQPYCSHTTQGKKQLPASELCMRGVRWVCVCVWEGACVWVRVCVCVWGCVCMCVWGCVCWRG